MPSDAAPLTPTAPQRKRLDGPLYKGFVLAVTKAASLYAVRCALAEDVPVNDGLAFWHIILS